MPLYQLDTDSVARLSSSAYFTSSRTTNKGTFRL